jgi:hypothetical protein
MGEESPVRLPVISAEEVQYEPLNPGDDRPWRGPNWLAACHGTARGDEYTGRRAPVRAVRSSAHLAIATSSGSKICSTVVSK